MKQLVILSGKGGTGKTTIASSFIALSKNRCFADCDVDAPNLEQMIAFEETIEKPFIGLSKASINKNICSGCLKCEENCKFNAISNLTVDPFKCEGCGVCEFVCRTTSKEGIKAITLSPEVSGKTKLSKNNSDIFSHAELFIGSGASGKLVSEIKYNLIKEQGKSEFSIIDGSPGIGCPVIASITGASMVLIVAEPTISGIHDLERIVITSERFGAKVAVIINKADINSSNKQKIKDYCANEGIKVIAEIPFDNCVYKAVNNGIPVVNYKESTAGAIIKEAYKTCIDMLLS